MNAYGISKTSYLLGGSLYIRPFFTQTSRAGDDDTFDKTLPPVQRGGPIVYQELALFLIASWTSHGVGFGKHDWVGIHNGVCIVVDGDGKERQYPEKHP